jgi:hypothetical protein
VAFLPERLEPPLAAPMVSSGAAQSEVAPLVLAAAQTLCVALCLDRCRPVWPLVLAEVWSVVAQ